VEGVVVVDLCCLIAKHLEEVVVEVGEENFLRVEVSCLAPFISSVMNALHLLDPVHNSLFNNCPYFIIIFNLDYSQILSVWLFYKLFKCMQVSNINIYLFKNILI